MSTFFDLRDRVEKLIEEADSGKVEYFSHRYYPVIRVYSEDEDFIADFRARLIAGFEADGLVGQVDEAEMSKPYIIDKGIQRLEGPDGDIIIYNPRKVNRCDNVLTGRDAEYFATKSRDYFYGSTYLLTMACLH